MSNFSDSPESNTYSPKRETNLKIPNQERLLPIGQHNKEITQLINKVKQALGIDIQTIKEANDTILRSNGNNGQIMQSPRRLIKQVALESPTQNDSDDTLLFKSVNLENKGMLGNLIIDIFIYKAFITTINTLFKSVA